MCPVNDRGQIDLQGIPAGYGSDDLAPGFVPILAGERGITDHVNIRQALQGTSGR